MQPEQRIRYLQDTSKAACENANASVREIS